MLEHKILTKFKKELSFGIPFFLIMSRCKTYLDEHRDWQELTDFYNTLKAAHIEEKLQKRAV